MLKANKKYISVSLTVEKIVYKIVTKITKKARANIPPDDIFQKEIRAIRKNAEQQFVSALVRFHKRRSQSHAKKLNRAKTARTRNSTNADISHQETQSSEHNVNNDVNRIDNLEKQISRIETILCKHLVNNNKRVESYQSVISEKPAKHSTTTTSQSQTKSSKRKHRRLNTAQRRTAIERETNEKYLKNLSDTPLTDDQVGVISKGLKFIPTPVTDKNKISQQLLRDFEQFARRMRLRYMFHGKKQGTTSVPCKIKLDTTNTTFRCPRKLLGTRQGSHFWDKHWKAKVQSVTQPTRCGQGT